MIATDDGVADTVGPVIGFPGNQGLLQISRALIRATSIANPSVYGEIAVIVDPRC